MVIPSTGVAPAGDPDNPSTAHSIHAHRPNKCTPPTRTPRRHRHPQQPQYQPPALASARNMHNSTPGVKTATANPGRDDLPILPNAYTRPRLSLAHIFARFLSYSRAAGAVTCAPRGVQGDFPRCRKVGLFDAFVWTGQPLSLTCLRLGGRALDLSFR